MDARLEINVQLLPEEPRRVVEAFERFAQENGMAEKTTQRFQLALDEVMTNVVTHAFPEETHKKPVISVCMQINESQLECLVEDNGPAFNPLVEAESPDISLAAEDRPIGGLGIFLAKSFVDTLEYERVDGRNRLTLIQPLES